MMMMISTFISVLLISIVSIKNDGIIYILINSSTQDQSIVSVCSAGIKVSDSSAFAQYHVQDVTQDQILSGIHLF